MFNYIDDTIASVLEQFRIDDDGNDDDESSNDNINNGIQWYIPDGSYMKQFPFTEPTPGMKSDILTVTLKRDRMISSNFYLHMRLLLRL